MRVQFVASCHPCCKGFSLGSLVFLCLMLTIVMFVWQINNNNNIIIMLPGTKIKKKRLIHFFHPQAFLRRASVCLQVLNDHMLLIQK